MRLPALNTKNQAPWTHEVQGVLVPSAKLDNRTNVRILTVMGACRLKRLFASSTDKLYPRENLWLYGAVDSAFISPVSVFYMGVFWRRDGAAWRWTGRAAFAVSSNLAGGYLEQHQAKSLSCHLVVEYSSIKWMTGGIPCLSSLFILE